MFGLSGLYTKLLGGLAIALLVLGLYLDRGRFMHRAHVAEAANIVACNAVRAASNRPKLDCDQMAQQVQFMGDALTAVKAQRNAALAEDKAHAIQVESNQNAISKESNDDYVQKIADVRAYYAKLMRDNANKTGANSGSGGSSSVPGASTASSGVSKAANENGLPQPANENGLPTPDALIATEQAIQLQSILDWAKKEGIAK